MKKYFWFTALAAITTLAIVRPDVFEKVQKTTGVLEMTLIVKESGQIIEELVTDRTRTAKKEN